MWIQHSDFRFNFTTWDELVHFPIHQQKPKVPYKIHHFWPCISFGTSFLCFREI